MPGITKNGYIGPAKRISGKPNLSPGPGTYKVQEAFDCEKAKFYIGKKIEGVKPDHYKVPGAGAYEAYDVNNSIVKK